MCFLAVLLNQDVDLDKSNLLHILRSRTNPIRCDRIWIECKILAASNAFCQLYILLSFWPAVQVAGGFIFADIGQCKNIKNKTIL